MAEVEREWGPFRRSAARRLLQTTAPPELIPLHWHWDWAAKGQRLDSPAYRCLGIECDQKIQGLMLLVIAGRLARLAPDVGQPLVYVDYLESAPWNVRPLVDAPTFGGIGAVLVRAAVAVSLETGFQGRIALHALPQAEEFYRDRCGMQGTGNDPAYQDLPYYEMARRGTPVPVGLIGGEVMDLRMSDDWLLRRAAAEANRPVSVGGWLAREQGLNVGPGTDGLRAAEEDDRGTGPQTVAKLSAALAPTAHQAAE